MANKRVIKKDIDYLVSEVITDCYTHFMLHGEKNKEKVMELIQQIVDERNNLIERVNNPASNPQKDQLFKLKRNAPAEYKASIDKQKKEVKKHYRAVYTDLLSIIDDSFTKLGELSK